MIRKLSQLLLIFWFGAVPILAETLSAAQYRLKIDPRAKISERVDTGWEKLMTVELEGQRARVRWKEGEVSVIFPDGTLRTKLSPGAGPASYELTTDFEGKRYRVQRGPREIGWLLPGEDIFFRIYGGKVTNVVGSSDYLKVIRDSRGGRISLESQAGTSDLLLAKGALEVFEGPDATAHTYFVRGLSFHRGPITLEIPLPKEPFLDALPPDRFLRVESKTTPAAPQEEPSFPSEPIPESSSRGPLDAEPSTWDSPIYRANLGNKKDDPLKARREAKDYRQKGDPLKAKTEENSEEILRVKDY